MTDPIEEKTDDDVLAGEYVLGVLEADERRGVELRLARDPAFAALVVFWVGRLTPLAESVTSVPAPARIKARIEAALFGANVPRPSLWASLALWRAASALFAVVALIAVPVALRSASVTQAPRAAYFAALTASGAPALLYAEIDPGRGVIRISDAALAELVADAEKNAELWLIPADGTPRSLGLINVVGETRAIAEGAVRTLLEAGGVLAVSIEPKGGSPTGAPTGPVVAVGALKRL